MTDIPQTFPAWVAREDGISLETIDPSFLVDRGTLIRVTHSSVNYKDALALHGRPGVVRTLPLVLGIDVTGEVLETDAEHVSPGDLVTLDGAGLGEVHHGGLAGLASVDAKDLVRVPPAFTAVHAAAIGTAGLTAALSVLSLTRHGVTPDSGPVLVTGASGGVGSIAVSLLSRVGFEVHAATGQLASTDRLRVLGAQKILDRAELEDVGRPMGAQRWAGAVDSVGGQVLATVISHLSRDGAVAACGLAGGSDLPTTVLPFILRGVSLLGINSVEASPRLRQQAWELLERDLDVRHLDDVTRVVPFSEARDAASLLLEGRGSGRVVVEVGAGH